jgi:hypothetical protein
LSFLCRVVWWQDTSRRLCELLHPAERNTWDRHSSSDSAGGASCAGYYSRLEGTLWPEPGYETFLDSSGATVELLPAIVKIVAAAKPVLESIPGSDPIARKAALQLLQNIKEGWVPFEF